MAKPPATTDDIAAKIDKLIGNTDLKPAPQPVVEPTVPEPVTETQEASAMIEANDPEGRQPGDPNDTIALPLELTQRHVPLFRVIPSDKDLSDEELAQLGQKSVENNEPRIDAVQQSAAPVPSDKALAEMQAGKAQIAQFAQENPHKLNETPPARANPFVEPPVAGVQQPAQAPTITDATRREMEAGAAQVAKREAEYAHNRETAKRDAARRAAEGAPADSGDLDYSAKD